MAQILNKNIIKLEKFLDTFLSMLCAIIMRLDIIQEQLQIQMETPEPNITQLLKKLLPIEQLKLYLQNNLKI